MLARMDARRSNHCFCNIERDGATHTSSPRRTEHKQLVEQRSGFCSPDDMEPLGLALLVSDGEGVLGLGRVPHGGGATPSASRRASTTATANNGYSDATDDASTHPSVATPAETAAEAAAAAALSAVPTPWVLVLCLTSLFFLFSGIENGVAPCIITSLQTSYNMSTASVTAAQSMTEVAKIVTSFGSGHYTSKAKVLFICAGSVVWAAGAIVLGSTVSVAMLYVGFTVLGIGYNFLSVLTPCVLEEHMPDKARVPYLLGICYAGAALGAAVGFLVCGLTIDFWRADFFVAAALAALPLLVLGRTVIKDTCASGGAVASEMKRSMQPELPLWATARLLLGNPVIAGSCVYLSFQLFYVNAFIALTPKFIEEGLGQSKSTASFVLAATVPAAVLGTVIGGWICKRAQLGLRGQLKFCLVTSAIACPMMFVFLLTNFASVATVFVLIMFVIFLNASPSFTLLALAVTDRRHVTYVNALVNIVSRSVGGIPGPIVLGVLIDNASASFSFSMAYLAVGLGAALLSLIGIAGALCRAPPDDDAAVAAGDAEMLLLTVTGAPAATAADGKSAAAAATSQNPLHRGGGGGGSSGTSKLHVAHPAAVFVTDRGEHIALPTIEVRSPSTAANSPTTRGDSASPMTRTMRLWIADDHLQAPSNTFLGVPDSADAAGRHDDLL